MADQEETFGLQNSPGGSESREVQNDNKSEKQNGTSNKSPSSQTTYIQQVSMSQCVGLTFTAAVPQPLAPSSFKAESAALFMFGWNIHKYPKTRKENVF